MAGETRLRTVNTDRDPLDEWSQKPSTRGQLEELRAKVNLLEYGGITADKLGGGTISTQSIELAESASLFSGSTTDDGFVLDVDGLRFYAGGVNTIDLRADGGAASFTGTITGGTFRTAASGARIELDEGTVDEIDFYSGDATELNPGRILVNADATSISFLQISPRTSGEDYAYTFVYGGKGAGEPGSWGAATFNSAGSFQNSIRLDSNFGLLLSTQDIEIVSGYMGIEIGGAYFDFARPGGTNASQLRFQSINAGGVTQVALGVDNAVVANGLIVHGWDGTTPLSISASAFSVISNSQGKKDIESLPAGVLSRVQQLNPVRYTRAGHKLEQRDGRADPGAAPDREFVGFLAEEMMIQFPEAVVKNKEGEPQAIDLMAMVAILTQAIQEMA